MIDKFKVFELNRETYKSASEKATELGHHKKARSLDDWSIINSPSTRVTTFTPISLGIFTLALNKYKMGERERIVYLSAHEASKTKGLTLVEEGPYKGYITDIFVDEYIFDVDEDIQEEVNAIPIICSFVVIDKDGSIILDSPWKSGKSYPIESSFSMYIPVGWKDDDLVVSKDVVDISQYSGDYITLFSNRKDAMKFKGLLKDMNKYSKYYYDKLRDFFLEYSSSKEWTKFINKVNAIPVNKLYYE